MSKFLKLLLRLFFAFRFFPYSDYFRKKNSNSKNVVLLYAQHPNERRNYLRSALFIQDIALLGAVAKTYPDFRLKISSRDCEGIRDSNLFYNISKGFNHSGDPTAFTSSIMDFVQQMQSQGNLVYPNNEDVEWWENKDFMHRRFDELGVKTPETILHQRGEEIKDPGFGYPILVKEIYSAGAVGVHKIRSFEELSELLNNDQIQERNPYVIIQRLLDIDRDLRVVLIGDEIVLYHWRINPDPKKWKPTTYSKGTSADFNNFPEDWRAHIIEMFKSFGMSTGAFDMAWERNDYSQAPYVFEIGSAYYPNPAPPKGIDMPYGNYKHGVRFFNSWEKHYIQQANNMKLLLVKNIRDEELVS